MKLWADAKATIGALTPSEGFMAYATDTDEIGTYDGAAWSWIAAGGSAPGGANKEVQYNNAGAFGGATGFEWQSADPNVIVNAQNAAHVVFVVKGIAAQTANLQNWENSAGSVKSCVGPDRGALALGKSSVGGTDRMLDVYYFQNAEPTTYQLSRFELKLNPSAPPHSEAATAIAAKVETAGAGKDFTNVIDGLTAFSTNVDHDGTGTASLMSGSLLRIRNTAAGTITNANGVFISSFTNSGGGTITNAHGLYVQDQTVATNNFAIRTNAGNVVFNEGGDAGTDFRVEGVADADLLRTDAANDRVGVGIAAPTAKLHVDQSVADAAEPVLYLDQADVSEEMIQFETTIGVGNAIEAIGVKTLTTTHFIKVTLPGGLTRYIPAGTIA